MPDIVPIEDQITDSEPLESFELDERADQEEIMSALKQMLDELEYQPDID